MEKLKLKSFGPISEAEINFGDLTLLVGPQASGKSILLQLLKLLIDKNNIKRTLEQYSFIWGKEENKILDFYFGEGMHKIWKQDSEIKLDNKTYQKDFLLPSKTGRIGKTSKNEETLFYIPAQRILSVADGRPKNFMEFDVSTPYVLRQFSETLRQLLQNGMDNKEAIFPINNRLKKPLRDSFNDSIFHNGKVIIDEKTGQKKLKMQVEGMNVPFIAWSAGQKEFMPLLMGFYWLCPPAKVSKKDDYKYVVIEEPEMGLHPQAIKSVILQVLDLLSRNYKVIISTHSPVLLEFAWAFNLLKKSKAKDDALFDLFDLNKSAPTIRLFKDLLSNKSINTFYFSREKDKVLVKDITSLDAGSEDEAVSEWGGLSQFSGKVTDVVSSIYDEESEG
jgi:energy-coupling factor transporter ATP-binding protein EcfA2